MENPPGTENRERHQENPTAGARKGREYPRAPGVGLSPAPASGKIRGAGKNQEIGRGKKEKLEALNEFGISTGISLELRG